MKKHDVVRYVRIAAEDDAELRRREERTGAKPAAQIRLLVHEGLRRRAVIQ